MALPTYEELTAPKESALPSYDEIAGGGAALPSYEDLVAAPAQQTDTEDAGTNLSPEQVDYKNRLADLQNFYQQGASLRASVKQASDIIEKRPDPNIPAPGEPQVPGAVFSKFQDYQTELRKKFLGVKALGPAFITDEQGNKAPEPPPLPEEEKLLAEQQKAADEKAKADAEAKRQERIKILGHEPSALETFTYEAQGKLADMFAEVARTFAPSQLPFLDVQEAEATAHDANVAAALGKGITQDVARGTADVLTLMSGTPEGKLGILHAAIRGATQAKARVLDETGDANKADAAAINSLITLPVILAAGTAASKFAGGLLPKEASALAKGATELGAGATANVGTDLLLHAVEGQPYDWQSFTTDALFALHGAWSRYAEAAKAKGNSGAAETAQKAADTVSEELQNKGETPPATTQTNAIDNPETGQINGGVRPRSEVSELPSYESVTGVQPGGQGNGNPEQGLARSAPGEAQQGEVAPTPERALGPGAANIEEFTPPQLISAKNAAIDEQRAARGLEPLVSEARKPDPVLWDQAMKRIERNDRAPDELVARINSNQQKTATDVEQTMLLWKIVDLHNKMDTEAQRALDPHADEGDRVEARLRYDQLEQERQATEEADRKVGTEQGRALRARRLMADENYNFAGLMRRIAVASRTPITPEQTVKIKADAEKVQAAKEKLDTETEKANAEQDIAKVKGAKAEVNLDEQRAKITAHLEAEQKKGTAVGDLKSFIQKLAENFVKSGVTEINALTTAVYGVVEPIFKGISEREVRDLFSGYGDFHALDKDPLKTELRRLRAEGQSVSKLEDVKGGKAPSKTGAERQAPSDLKRRLEKEVRELMKKNGITTTDAETQLKSSLDARKTALKNQIKDLTFQIETGEKPKAGEPPPSDAELEGLRKLRDSVRDTLQSIEGDPQMTDEQRAKIITAQLDRQIAEHERILKNGGVRTEGGKIKPLTTPEIEARRATLDSLKAQVEEIKASDQTAKEEKQFDATMARADALEKKLASGDFGAKETKQFGPDTELVSEAKDHLASLRDQLKAARAAAPEATQAKLDAAKAAVEQSIAKLDQRIQNEDFASTKKAQSTTPEIEALRAERDAMRKLFNELKSATLPKLTPEQRAQKALMTSLTRRTAELASKLAAGDFTKPPKRVPTPLTPALVKAKADYERVKLEVDRGIEKLRLKNRTKLEKVADATAKWVRFGVLTGYSTLEKLTGAAIARVALNVPEEAVGSVFRKVFPGVAAKAPLEGRGFEPGVEARAIVSGLTQGWKDAFKLLTTGHSDLDTAFSSKRDVAPRSWLDFVGALHGALKSNVKRTFFERAQEKLLLDAAAKGRDITDPMVQTQVAMEAYKEANRSIFLNSNRIVEGFQAMLARWAAPDSQTGKVSIPGKIAATAAKILVPVVRIPANIVAETLGQYATGLLHGIPRAIGAERAIRAGASELSPVEADAIMRSLKKGSIGTSLLLLGYFGYKNVGGYYAPGQKRDENKEPNFGEAQIFGWKIPKAFLHNPALEAIQLGATVRRVADSKLRKSDTEQQGLMTGIGRALLAASEEVPFIGEAMHLSDLKEAHGGEKFFFNQVKTLTEPQILQQLAKYFDKDKSGKPVKRQEKTLSEVLKGGIPFLRQTVPVKR